MAIPITTAINQGPKAKVPIATRVRKVISSLYLILSIPAALFAITPIGPVNFGGGLNVLALPTDVQDNECTDCSNMVGDRTGGATTRYGSRRFIDTPISTNPVTTLYRAYASTGSLTKKYTFATTSDRIVYSTSDLNPVWYHASSGSILTRNQNYSFVTMNNRAIMTGDALTDDILQVDLVTQSSATPLLAVLAGSDPVKIQAKYLLVSKNYLIAANCKDLTVTTATYANRLYYSLLNQPSSFTATRFINVKTTEGEEITGLGEIFGNVNIFFDSSIYELSFTVLNLGSLGGDFTLTPIVKGFGCIAPKTLVNTGLYYVFLSRDGVRIWDGGRRSRLNVGEETEIISQKVSPIIEDLIHSGNYKRATATYNGKRNWYILSFEDPNKFPTGKNNSVLIYDFTSGNWFRMNNWLAGGLASFEGAGDTGDILYGDSNDGYVHYADDSQSTDDSRKEISIQDMDVAQRWTSSTLDSFAPSEGAASLKISLPPAGGQSSMTYISVINAGEWYDRSKITKADYFQFDIRPTTIGNISSLRVDLEVKDVNSAFDSNFTSITFTSPTFASNNNWNTIRVPISSFPIRPDWTDFGIEEVPFANTLTFYGLRFVLNGISSAAISIDNVRIVQSQDNPLNAYWTSKLFNFGNMNTKGYRYFLLTREKAPDASIYVDIFNDFGDVTRTDSLPALINKEIYVCGFNGSTGVSRLSSVDFALVDSTVTPFSVFNGTADRDFLYLADRTNERIVKIQKSSIAAITSTYGQIGSGTTNFNTIHQMQNDQSAIYLVDLTNQRIKAHDKKTYTFLRSFGSLGLGTSNFHQPTGIAVDANNVFVSDEGNYRLVKLNKSSFGVVLNADIDFNTIGDSSLQVDGRYLYMAYNKISESSVDNLDVVVEKRNKSDLKLVDKKFIRPENMVSLSTYSLMGDIAILGDYIFISFTDSLNFDANSRYYIQKLRRDDFSFVNEYVSQNKSFSVIGDGQSYIPQIAVERRPLQTEGKYIQLRYYGKDQRDNRFRLYNQAFIVNEMPFKEE